MPAQVIDECTEPVHAPLASTVSWICLDPFAVAAVSCTLRVVESGPAP